MRTLLAVTVATFLMFAGLTVTASASTDRAEECRPAVRCVTWSVERKQTKEVDGVFYDRYVTRTWRKCRGEKRVVDVERTPWVRQGAADALATDNWIETL